MAYSRDLTGTTHTVHQSREVRWGPDMTNLLLDLIALNNGTPQTVTPTTGATTVDLSLSRNITISLGMFTTITLTNLRPGERYFFIVSQQGSNAMAWANTIKWRGGSSPSITNGAGAIDSVVLYNHPTLGLIGDFAQGYA